MLRRFVSIVFVIASLSLAAAAQNWSEARTVGISVVSPLGDGKTVAAAQNLQQMRDVMGRLLARPNLHIPAPTYVLLCSSQAEMKTVLGGTADAGEAAHVSPDLAFFAYDVTSDAAFTRFLFDFGRYLIEANYPHTPPWFDDGLAEYFSTARIADGIHLEMGVPTRAIAGALQQSDWIPLEQVLSAGPDSPLRQRAQFRAESWAIIAYVFSNQRVGDTGRYFGLTQIQGVAVPDAVQQAYGMSAAQFDQAVRAAVQAIPSKPAKHEAPAAPAEGSIKVFVETPADLGALAADYRLHAAPSDNDLAQLQSLLQAGNNIAVLRTLGFGYLQKKDFDRATDFLKRAAALAPDDFRTQYYLGALAYEQGGGGDSGRMPLQAAVSADPDFADAYYLLGMTLLGGADRVDGIRALQAAVRLAPRHDDYSLALAGAYLQARDFDLGEAVLDRLTLSPDPQIAAAAAKKRSGIAALKAAPPEPDVDVSVYRYHEKQWGDPSGQIPSLDQLDSAVKQRDAEAAAGQRDTRPVRYARGLLMGIDCSQSPAAILTVVVNTKPVTFYSANLPGLPVIGAGSLSCSLKNRTVSLNYRPGSTHADNDLVSVELK